MGIPELPAFIKLAKEACGILEGKCVHEIGRDIQKRGVVITLLRKSNLVGAIVFKNTFSQ